MRSVIASKERPVIFCRIQSGTDSVTSRTNLSAASRTPLPDPFPRHADSESSRNASKCGYSLRCASSRISAGDFSLSDSQEYSFSRARTSGDSETSELVADKTERTPHENDSVLSRTREVSPGAVRRLSHPPPPRRSDHGRRDFACPDSFFPSLPSRCCLISQGRNAHAPPFCNPHRSAEEFFFPCT